MTTAQDAPLNVLVNDELSIPALVAYLSRPSLLPSSIKVRNKLLRPYAFPSFYDGPIVPDPSPSTTFFDNIGRGSIIAAFGQVPLAVRADADSKTGDSGLEEPLWALCVLNPSHRDVERQSQAPRLDLWISSEATLNRYDASINGQSKDATTALSAENDADRESLALLQREEKLLLAIAFDWLPTALPLVEYHHEPSRIGTETCLSVLLCGVAERFSVALNRHADGRRLRSNGNGKAFHIVRRFHNPCILYLRTWTEAEPELRLAGGAGWESGNLRDDEVSVVANANKIPFPTHYIREHLHVSTVLRSTSESGGPTPAGWAYSHDDFALASLHVAPPFRRRRIPLDPPSGTEPSHTGIGSFVVSTMGRKLVGAQQHALRCAGFDPPPLAPSASSAYDQADVAPFIAHCEVTNPARAFFEKIGFVPCFGNNWTEFDFMFEHDST